MSVKFDFYGRLVKAQQEDDQLRRIKEHIEKGELWEFHIDNGVIEYGNRLCVPQINEIKEEIMQEAHSIQCTAQLGSTEMFQDLRHNFWWNRMKRDIAEFVQKSQMCQQVKAEHIKPLGLLVSLPI